MAHFVFAAILPVLIAGAMLGRRFSVLVLVPAGFLVVVVIVVFGTALSASLWGCVVASVLGLACLQIGYLGAVAIGQFNRQPHRASQHELKRYGRNQ
jgi:hypothetical protein